MKIVVGTLTLPQWDMTSDMEEVGWSQAGVWRSERDHFIKVQNPRCIPRIRPIMRAYWPPIALQPLPGQYSLLRRLAASRIVWDKAEPAIRTIFQDVLNYGGRLVSKLHSDAFAKLEHVLLSFEYAFFIRVWSLHLGMLFSFGYGLFIWVCYLHLGIVFLFGYGLCIWV